MEKKQFKIGLGTAIMLFLLLLIMLIWFGFNIINKDSKKQEVIVAKENKIANEQEDETISLKENEGVIVVPTMQDEITADSSWCATFQLVWNDMKNEVVKKDIVFTPQEKMAENLNKEEFTQEMISDEYYYKKYGLKTLALKEEIEKGIKEKFNQESDILDSFDWSEKGVDNTNNPNTRRYFFYTMLYRKFDFLKEFDKLEDGKFGTKYDNIKYFGIDKNTDDSAKKQIDVLYYNSKDDFAIILNTKSDDEVILCKGPKGQTFKEIYDNMISKANNYEGNNKFEDEDELKVPNLEFDIKREYKEFEDKSFETADPIYNEGKIAKAVQTIKFSLDEKGGEIKSEAATDARFDTCVISEKKKPRYFYLDDTFAIFLKESGKEIPYFAARVNDISKFQ